MRASRLLSCVFWLLTGVAASAAEPPAVLPKGPSFRVETELFQGDAVEPAAQHLILFDSGVIYDLRVDDQRSATMYDPARGRVILIDRVRKQQTVLATSDLTLAMAQLRAAAEREGKADRFGLEAQVTPGERVKPTDPETLEIRFSGVYYRTTVETVNQLEIAHAYNHFATLAAQLNVLRRRGVPPFARLTLGQYLAEAGQLPLAMDLEVRNGLRKERYRAHHLVVERLSDTDRKQIQELGRDLAQCEEVPLEDFQE